MRKFACMIMLAGLVGTAPVWAADLANVPMNAQINLGYTYNTQSPGGNAIYAPNFNAALPDDGVTIFADGALEPQGFTRHAISGEGKGSWWYQYLDFNLAGVTAPGSGLNLSDPSATVKFDTRYFQDFETNPNPYADAPVFLRLYTYAADGNTYVGHRDYSIVYATQPPLSNPPYPAWTTVTVNVSATAHADGGTFNAANVSRIRWYGTDWQGTGFDFVDFKNVVVTPEPASLVLLALGGLLIRRRRA